MKDRQIIRFPAVPETNKGVQGIPKTIKNIDGVKYLLKNKSSSSDGLFEIKPMWILPRGKSRVCVNGW